MLTQEKTNYCLCAILQNIFKEYKINLTQDEIADNLMPSEKGFYANGERIEVFMRLVGFDYKYYSHNKVPFNEHDSLLEEMNQNEGLLGFNEHAYRLKEFNDPYIGLIDPSDNSETVKELSQLILEMKKGNGFFGLIKRLR